jgi:hypothetical protein
MLIGETVEPNGSIYAGQHRVHLFASRDGSSWVDVMQRPVKPDGAGYAYIDAYYQYPDGSVPLLIAGYGTVVVRVGPPFPTNTLRDSQRLASRTSNAASSAASEPPAQSSARNSIAGLGIGLLAAAAVLLAAAAAVRRIGLDRGVVAIGSVVVQPIQLVAGAVSLVVAGILATLIA